MSPTTDCCRSLCDLPKVETLKDLISELHKIFSSDNVNVDYVQALMESYKSKPSEWRQFAIFDQYRYTRNLVDAGNGKFNLMLICWGEGHGSAIHDHSDAHCFMKVLSGSITEVRFAWPEGEPAENQAIRLEGMKELGRTEVKKESVCYINDSLGLHRVENSSHVEPAVSLHLYCPPFSSCQMFDEKTGKKTTAKVTFWSKYGVRTPFETTKSYAPENN